MSNNHGKKLIKTTTDWHTAKSKQAKKKAYQDKVGEFIKKSTQNAKTTRRNPRTRKNYQPSPKVHHSRPEAHLSPGSTSR
jgi:hypothetical protein